MNDSILSLINGCLSNDNACWTELLETCASVSTNILKKRFSSLSPPDIDNIISNIYTKLIDGGLKGFRGESKYEFLNYIRIITRNETVTYLQHMKRNRADSLDSEHDDDDESNLYTFLEDNSLRPDTIAEINDLYRNAMCQLSIRDKQILLYKIEGYKDKEIAELLGIPMNTVASSYNRIKELLQKTLLISVMIILFGRNLLRASSL